MPGSDLLTGGKKSALWVMFQGSYKHVVITDAVASLSAQLVAVLFWRRTTCSFYSIQVFYLRF